MQTTLAPAPLPVAEIIPTEQTTLERLAETLRDVLHARKIPDYSPEVLEEKRASVVKARLARQNRHISVQNKGIPAKGTPVGSEA